MEKLKSINYELEQRPKFDLIWTLDKICAWNCSLCCVDARYVKKKNDLIHIESNGLNINSPYIEGNGSVYMQAATILRERGLALSVDQKLIILAKI